MSCMYTAQGKYVCKDNVEHFVNERPNEAVQSCDKLSQKIWQYNFPCYSVTSSNCMYDFKYCDKNACNQIGATLINKVSNKCNLSIEKGNNDCSLKFNCN